MPNGYKDIEKLIRDNPRLAEYIQKIKQKAKEGYHSAKEKVSNIFKKVVNRDTDEKTELVSVDSKKFSLFKEIKKHPLYRRNNHDEKAREMIELYKAKDKKRLSSKNYITPGQLVLFKYLNPKTKEELEYYDASPCTIFFGIFNSKQGKRVLGFNTHYFPPQIRYRIMDKIYEMYKPVYRKYFETGAPKELDGFDYRYLVDELEKHNLSFAVRMYIPQLIGDVYIVPPKMWPTALLTEGWFKKQTMVAIMNFFKKDAQSKKKIAS